MGQVILNRWEVVTEFDNTFFSGGKRFDVSGMAHVEHEDDDDEAFTSVRILDPDEENVPLVISVNDIALEPDSTAYDIVHDMITEVLESEINPQKTELANEDFKNVVERFKIAF